MRCSLFLVLLFLLFAQHTTSAQDIDNRWRAQLSLGQFPASIAVPSFSPLRPGIQAGLSYQWNQNDNIQFLQTGNLAYFFHREVQHVVQLYTESSCRFQLKNGLGITPLAIGGGYVFSVQDMPTLVWNEDLQQYEQDRFPTRHNWMISLGFSVSYDLPFPILKQDEAQIFVDYRLQVQGIFIQNTVPVVAYTPLRLGVSIPVELVKKDE